MDIIYKDIREEARKHLKGSWKVVIWVSLVYKAANIIENILPEFNTLWSILIPVIMIIYSSVFLFGYSSIILKIVRGEKVKFQDLFSGRFLKSLGMSFVVGLYTLLWSLLLIVPGIIASAKYSMTYYVWVDNPNISISEAIDKSIHMTNGHIWEIIKLCLSFWLWFCLIFLSAGIVGHYLYKPGFDLIVPIGMIFLAPYIDVAMGTLYNRLTKEIWNYN